MATLYGATLAGLMPDPTALLPETLLLRPGVNLLNDSKRLAGLANVSGQIYVLDGK